ncbi:hypothetical protein M0R45_012700 [Rubus argutus]|uniref:Galactinol--sucrose galactosyltransferase 2 n=1 Tax=Rubus argutus TaxID=59490 RepID=A0AAW1XH03_RUBAR
MGQSTDTIYHARRSAITRASDDYYPKNPTTQTLHIAAVAFNSIFLGEVFVPDWDMFYSRHEAAEFHAAARAVGGCGVYHDFEILKRLVLPDGSVLRARYPGRPSRDCLFVDPVMDGKSLLKIWNLNKCNGVIGIFNCQGAGSWPCLEHIVQVKASDELSGKVLLQISSISKRFLESFGPEIVQSIPSNKGVCLVYPRTSHWMSHYNFSNVMCLLFPLLRFTSKYSICAYWIIEHGRGAGSFGAYSSLKPKSCSVNSKDEGFEFRGDNNLLTVTIPATTSSWNISFCY